MFVGLLIGLQVFYVVRWILGSITEWVLFIGYGRKQLARHLSDYLRENKYPEPGQYEDSAQSYLTRVAEDKKLPVSLRLKAAAELGALQAWRNLMQLGLAFRLELAYESALEQYKRMFPSVRQINGKDEEFDEEVQVE